LLEWNGELSLRLPEGGEDMPWPHITAFYLAVLALIYTVLAFNVARLRYRNRAAFGDGDNPALRSAIRAHAHFAEYVPIITLMVAMLEMSGIAASRVHLLMGALLVSRLAHPAGMYAKPMSPSFRIFRVGGMWLTMVLLVTCAVMILTRLWRSM
jgi:uncharacterized membrane protein YecN with MAPEG domain